MLADAVDVSQAEASPRGERYILAGGRFVAKKGFDLLLRAWLIIDGQIDVPLWHIMAKTDHYFNHHVVEQHLRIIFDKYDSDEYDLGAHTPSVIADEKTAAARPRCVITTGSDDVFRFLII